MLMSALLVSSLQAHFRSNATGQYYMLEEGKEQCKYTLIYIFENDLFVGLLVTNERVMKPNSRWPAVGIRETQVSSSLTNKARYACVLL